MKRNEQKSKAEGVIIACVLYMDHLLLQQQLASIYLQSCHDMHVEAAIFCGTNAERNQMR